KNESKNNEILNAVSQNMDENGENVSVTEEVVVNKGKDVGNDCRLDCEGVLNGAQFVETNELNRDKSLNHEEVRECLDEGGNSVNNVKNVDCAEKQENKESSAGKQSEKGSMAWGSANGGIKLVDMIKGSKLDNKLM
ncbi:hypothetical protein Tco_0457048, partial [Tanacetum coccineum]